MRMPGMAAVIGLVLLSGCASRPETADEKAQMQAEVMTMADRTLEKLYEKVPSARGAIQNASGYAVFSNFGMKILLAGGGRGQGVAVRNDTGEKVYMKMVELQAGLGWSVKKFQLVWVFAYRGDLDAFTTTGWELGAQAMAAAHAGGEGIGLTGAISIKPGVWLYQLIDDGVALDLTVKGTKYFRDSGLN